MNDIDRLNKEIEDLKDRVALLEVNNTTYSYQYTSLNCVCSQYITGYYTNGWWCPVHGQCY